MELPWRKSAALQRLLEKAGMSADFSRAERGTVHSSIATSWIRYFGRSPICAQLCGASRYLLRRQTPGQSTFCYRYGCRRPFCDKAPQKRGVFVALHIALSIFPPHPPHASRFLCIEAQGARAEQSRYVGCILLTMDNADHAMSGFGHWPPAGLQCSGRQ